MKYTAIFTNPDARAGYSTDYFVASHDKRTAWQEIVAQTPVGRRLLFIVPGEQIVYNPADTSLTEVA
jgi:hypothetical protein